MTCPTSISVPHPTMTSALSRLTALRRDTEALMERATTGRESGELTTEQADYVIASLKQDLALIALAEETVMTEATHVALLTPLSKED